MPPAARAPARACFLQPRPGETELPTSPRGGWPMLRRLLAVIVLLVVVLAVFAYLGGDHLTAPAGAAAPNVRAEARDLGAQARHTLHEVGTELKDAKVTATVKTALGLN